MLDVKDSVVKEPVPEIRIEIGPASSGSGAPGSGAPGSSSLSPSLAEKPVAPQQVTPSARVVKPPSTEQNTVTLRDMMAGRDNPDNEDLHRFIVNGQVVHDPQEKVSPEKGPYRYLRANGISDCLAYGMSGTLNGLPASGLAHLPSTEYLNAAASKQVDENCANYLKLQKFAAAVDAPQRLAATHIQRTYDPGPSLRPALRGAPIHNTGANGGSDTADFFLDAEDFDLHKVGPKDKETGAVVIGESVRASPTTAQVAAGSEGDRAAQRDAFQARLAAARDRRAKEAECGPQCKKCLKKSCRCWPCVIL